jgi:hypothetical protein
MAEQLTRDWNIDFRNEGDIRVIFCPDCSNEFLGGHKRYFCKVCSDKLHNKIGVHQDAEILEVSRTSEV